MGNLRFAYKALIISLVFLLPVVLLGYFFVTAQNDQIAFSAKERTGVEAYKQFVPVSTALLKLRNATRAGMGGLNSESRFKLAKDQLDSAIKSFDQYVLSSGDPLDTKEEFQKLKSQWAKASMVPGGVDVNGRTVFGPLNEAVAKVFGKIGDNSNLVLDPDIDSYYLYSVMNALPQLSEDTGQLWGWGSYALARAEAGKAPLDGKEATRFAIWSANVKSSLEVSKVYLDKAFAYNPSIKSSLDLTALEDAARFQAMSSDIQGLVASKSMKSDAYFDQGEASGVH
ncbi:MAG: hypothetical protein CFE44_24760, partial [Burkholderiales bacterium PBB4]